MKKCYKITTCKNTHRTRNLGSPANVPTGRVRKMLKFSLLENKKHGQKNKTRVLPANNRTICDGVICSGPAMTKISGYPNTKSIPWSPNGGS